MMKAVISPVSVLIMFVLLAPFAFAAEEPSVELGKKLFNNPGLGASQNAISCVVCHPDGEGLQNAGQKSNLTETINQCIIGPLKGEALYEDTVAMKSLVMYIQSLAK